MWRVAALILTFLLWTAYAGTAPSVTGEPLTLGVVSVGPAINPVTGKPVALTPAQIEAIKEAVNGADKPGRQFDTLHEAAVYDAGRLEDCSHVYECAGLIAKTPDGKFIVGPVWSDTDSDHVEMKERFHGGLPIAADIHSHPCLPNHDNGFFSPADMIGSVVRRTIGYMVNLCTGEVHEFLPGITKIDETFTPGGIYLSAGTVIGRVNAYPDAAMPNEGL